MIVVSERLRSLFDIKIGMFTALFYELGIELEMKILFCKLRSGGIVERWRNFNREDVYFREA